jgi:chorismate synthase
MAGNTFGSLFRLTTFGESHGPAIGGIIEGCPAGLKIDHDFILSEMLRRRPGQSQITTQRNEEDFVEFVSGIFKGVTTGVPIGFLIRNADQRPSDYTHLEDTYRPSHADFTYDRKYGHRDHRGGGRSSARETAARVAAGAFAKLLLKQKGITINAFVKQVGTVMLDKDHDQLDLSLTDSNIVRCPEEITAQKMIKYIEDVRKLGDTAGGIVQCVINNVPVGLGEPVFDKFPALLAHAILSINAVKGFEIGAGFSAASKKGSELNDLFNETGKGDPLTKTNHSGGVQGGISNGMPIFFNVAFKPVSTLMKEQKALNKSGKEVNMESKGRHDPCVVPRAVPIVEAMAALVTADLLLLANNNRI